MESLVPSQFSLFNAITCWCAVCSTTSSFILSISGVFSTLLLCNCTNDSVSVGSEAAQGQLSSINVQYELCNNSLSELTSILFFVGMGIGSLIVGPMSDLVGRIPTITVGIAAAIVTSLVGNYCSQFWLHLVTRCVSGAGVISVQCASHVYGNEANVQQQRGKFNAAWSIGMCIGGFIGTASALLTKNHQTYMLISTSICAVTLLSVFWLPESPLWLLERGKLDRAVQSLRLMAKINRSKAPSAEQVNNVAKEVGWSEQQQQKPFLKSLLHLDSRNRLHLKVVVAYGFGITMNSYGFFFVISKIVSNVYIYMALATLTFIPSAALMGIFSRRMTLLISGLGGGVSSAVVALLTFLWLEMPQSVQWIALTVGLLGTFFSSCGYVTVMTAAAELFPTNVRNTCMGILYIVCRVAAVTPLIIALIQNLPIKIGLSAFPILVTCWAVLLLPDSRIFKLHIDTVSQKVSDCS